MHPPHQLGLIMRERPYYQTTNLALISAAERSSNDPIDVARLLHHLCVCKSCARKVYEAANGSINSQTNS